MSLWTSFRSALDRSLLAPVRAMRAAYLPLLMIYFAYGAGQITRVAQTFFERRTLSLPADELAALGVWLTVPWTIKMVFGQLVDSIAILGSRRRVYVFLGATLITAGYGLMVLSARSAHGANALYIAGQLVLTVGLVLQDVVADTMSTEVVPRTNPDGTPRDEHAIEADLGMVQLLGRLALMLGILVTSLLGGYLAEHLGAATVFAIGLVVPVLSVLGAIFVKVDIAEAGHLDYRILGGGILFGCFTVAMGLYDVPFAQEIVFAVSMTVVCTLLYLTVRDSDRETLRSIAVAALVIFVYRATPNVGPGASWWQIDELGFDESFMGWLDFLGSLIAILGMWFGSRAVTERPIGQVLAALTIIGFVLYLPFIGMKYGLHHWTERHLGIGARAIAVFDTSIASPFAQLSMIPMLTLIAVNAPPGKRATWFALMASLMNLALSAAGLGTKYLTRIFVVTRGHYDALGPLMITANLISLVIPLAVIAFTAKRIASTKPTPAPEPT